MKRFNLLCLLTGCLLLASCSGEDFRSGINPEVTDGIPVTATLSFRTSDSKAITKAAEVSSVNDLYVLAFNTSGKLSTAQYFGSDTLAKSGSKVQATMLSGTNYIYAVANITTNSLKFNSKTMKQVIDEFAKSSNNTLDSWKSQSAVLTATQVTGDAPALMTGFYAPTITNGDGLTGDGSCLITTTGAIDASTPGAIQLVRVASLVSFHIDVDKSEGSRATTFQLTSWEVHQAPTAVYLHKQATVGTPSGVTPFNVVTPNVTSNDFNFFLLENRQQAHQSIAALGFEKESYEEADTRENPAYYPTAGTYVVLKGAFVGYAMKKKESTPAQDGSLGEGNNDTAEGDPVTKTSSPEENGSPAEEESTLQPVKADVTYYIHLGYINGADDYSVLRNHQYTYNITIAGIDRIIVEANGGEITYRADGTYEFILPN